jgi:hypothetical protein
MRPAWWSVLVLGPALAAPAPAQQYGQWHWSANVELRQVSFDREVRGLSPDSTREDEVSLRLGLGGYVLSPAIAAFRLDLQAAVARFEGMTQLDSDRLGGRASLFVLPRGAYPLRLFYARERYEYLDAEEATPRFLRSLPDLVTRWELAGRLRRGPLKGLRYGTEHSDIEFLVPGQKPEVRDRQHLAYDAPSKKLRHRYELEREFRSLGRLAYETEDYTFNTSVDGELKPGWRFNLFGVAIDRTLTLDARRELGFETARLQSQLSHTTRGDDVATLRYAAGLARSENSPTVREQTVLLRYTWQARERWRVTPFVGYTLQQADGTSLDVPQVGVTVNWDRTAGPFEVALNGQGAYGESRQSRPGRSAATSAVSFGFGGSLSHGSEETLRSTLEVDWGMNEFSAVGDPITDLADLGTGLNLLGAEDRRGGRLTLQRRWDKLHCTLYSDWRRREASDDLSGLRSEVETLTHSLQTQYRRYLLTVNAGSTEAKSGDLDQQVDFVAAGLSVQFSRFLSLRASYRQDTRTTFGLDADGEEVQAGVDFNYGQLVLRASAFELAERLATSPERTSRGLRWSVSRRFGGYLPIVTAPRRRGVIR